MFRKNLVSVVMFLALALSASGCGGPTDGGSANVPDTSAPSSPGWLSASVIAPSQIDLAWATSTDNVGVARYKVFRGGVLVATVSGAAYSDSGLADGSRHCYTVSASDAAGNDSAWSPQQCATTTIFRFPDTGQATSYTATFGEDGDYAGNPPSYKDNGDGTVTDMNTGIMWQQAPDGLDRTHAAAASFCASLSLGGHSDWRLPGVKELQSIVDFDAASPAVDAAYFPGIGSYSYWASTTSAQNVADSWSVEFLTGQADAYGGYSFKARCVRGAERTASLADNGDGTITDTLTGLMWQRQDDRTARAWEQALAYCEGLSLAGASDWRLPNITELQSIVDYGTSMPAIDGALFPGLGMMDPYWSSTTNAGSIPAEARAWYVQFYGGQTQHSSKMDSNYVRCVRL
jgi:hypothetical protein